MISGGKRTKIYYGNDQPHERRSHLKMVVDNVGVDILQVF
jgi:hypothetical protein